MSAKKPALPLSWYFTPAELAHEWGVHPDRIMYFCDAGLIEPAALVPKSRLPTDCSGPAPYLCVLLPDYRNMTWDLVDGERAAALAGEYRAFQVDGEAFRNITLRDGDRVMVSRSDLVIPLDQREAVEAMGAMAKPINPTERTTMLRIIGQLLRDAYPDIAAKPYTMAERITAGLWADGVGLGKQAIANKINDALGLMASAESEAA